MVSLHFSIFTCKQNPFHSGCHKKPNVNEKCFHETSLVDQKFSCIQMLETLLSTKFHALPFAMSSTHLFLLALVNVFCWTCRGSSCSCKTCRRVTGAPRMRRRAQGTSVSSCWHARTATSTCSPTRRPTWPPMAPSHPPRSDVTHIIATCNCRDIGRHCGGISVGIIEEYR